MNVQFCCGTNIIRDWKNYDREIDITKHLSFDRESIDNIFIEHGIEHITQLNAIDFVTECFRILRWNGILRIAWPDIGKIGSAKKIAFNRHLQNYFSCVVDNRKAVYLTMTKWGHQSFYTADSMRLLLWACGFTVSQVYEPGKSDHLELCNLEQHYKHHSVEINDIQTSCLEGQKMKELIEHHKREI